MSVAPASLVRMGRHYLERDGRPFIPVGAHLVPVEGPDWPWRVTADTFDRAFAAMSAAGLDSVRIDILWAAVEPAEGRYDDEHLRILDDVLEAARRHGILLHPTLFIGGEVGDAYWDVPWRNGRHPHADPEMRRLQAAHAAMLARRWRDHPALLAWDLTDEPPFWLFRETTDDDARTWTGMIVDAIHGEDPRHLITIGTSGQEIGWGPFRADVVADALDFTCVHPYPIYQEDLYPDALLSPRMTHAGAFETSLAAGAGKSVMVHEYGASSAQFEPDSIAQYDRLLTWASFGYGAAGFFAWCWTDAEPAACRRAPYVRQPHETQFGVTDDRGRPRPRGEGLAQLAQGIRELDLARYASDGPAPPQAALAVPHEYVYPYDAAAYGLGPSSGPYVPAETAWAPHRDIQPLVSAWLNAFVLAARAGITVSFPRERLDDAWPDVRVLLLPAPLASTSSSHLHVRTSFWSGAEAFFGPGGTLYLSCSADVAIPQMDDLAGCRIGDRAPVGSPVALRFLERWGPFEPGDELQLPPSASGSDLHLRGIRLRLTDAHPIALDNDGEPALVVAERGNGHTVTCAYPIELLLAARADAHEPQDRSYGLYRGLADLAGIVQIVDHPEVTTGHLVGAEGGVIVCTNHGRTPVEAELRVPGGTTERVNIEAYGHVVRVYDVTP
jgi:endo-1,4-beta-mannosidase